MILWQLSSQIELWFNLCMCEWSVLYFILATTGSSYLSFVNLLLICEFPLSDQGSTMLLWFMFWAVKPLSSVSAHNRPHASICGIICDHGLGLCLCYIMQEMLLVLHQVGIQDHCSALAQPGHKRTVLSFVIRLINLANWHLFLSLKEAAFQLLTALCESGARGRRKWGLLLEGEPWERELVKVQCGAAVTATKKRFLSVVVVIVKLVTPLQITSEQLTVLEGGQYFFMWPKQKNMVLIGDLVGCWVEVHSGLVFFHLHIKILSVY